MLFKDRMDEKDELSFWVVVLLVFVPVAALVFTYFQNRKRNLRMHGWAEEPGFEFPLEEVPQPEDIPWHTRVGEEIVERTAEAEAQDVSLAEADTAEETQSEAQAQAEEVAQVSAVPEAPSEQDSSALDDLTRIEGIGPRTEQVFYGAGIKTFRDLANASQERLNQVLDEAGLRSSPDTWPEQAALAAEGRWEELDTLQSHLQRGRRAE